MLERCLLFVIQEGSICNSWALLVDWLSICIETEGRQMRSGVVSGLGFGH